MLTTAVVEERFFFHPLINLRVSDTLAVS